MGNYVIINGELRHVDELMHYGVPGMRWGTRPAERLGSVNSKLQRKALKYDVRVAKLQKKAEKAHAERDLGAANRKAVQAARLRKKAAKAQLTSTKATNDFAAAKAHRKAERLNYKAAKAERKANRLSKSTGYGAKAMGLSIKADKVAAKAAKARSKIANNEFYIERMKRKAQKKSA